MEIKHLTELNNTPLITSKDGTHQYVLKPIPVNEITQLESTYNLENPFPAALTELLFLAGAYCYGLDTGFFGTQSEMQESARAKLLENNIQLSRKFFVIDVYNFVDQCLMIYLDEEDDPIVYEMAFDLNAQPRNLNYCLSELINTAITKLSSGYNPF